MLLRTGFIALTILLPSLLFGADAMVSIETRPSTELRYAWITSLTEGPANWDAKNEQTKIQGKLLRFVHYDGPEEMPATFRIEEITFGIEGLNRKLLQAREFQIAEPMFNAFGPFAAKDENEFDFVKWLGPTSLEFKYYGKTFVLYDLDQKVLRIRPR